VRAFAASEVALSGWCLVNPGRVNAALLAGMYAGFAALSAVLARRHASCGCFGERDAPASVAQSIVSVLVALVVLAATIRTPHAVAWIVNRPAPSAAILLLGIAASVYGTVLAYVELPAAWYSWSPR
ncbi:MAG: MauE/DoxX family redox-associated membrane protein, partial [Solirubrobacteraceae bacterium]